MDFVSDRISEADLISGMGASKWNQCEGNFYAGLRRLSVGDRDQAKNHFLKCVETQVFGFYEYLWGRVFLTRMEEDPNWPPWIPVKKQDTSK
ncbi:MAG: hypothetical protein O2960_12385 [Verrucomicrobia bacterium]|nr:hypothetical protein [Verrucomicrobiota bacterium]